MMRKIWAMGLVGGLATAVFPGTEAEARDVGISILGAEATEGQPGRVVLRFEVWDSGSEEGAREGTLRVRLDSPEDGLREGSSPLPGALLAPGEHVVAIDLGSAGAGAGDLELELEVSPGEGADSAPGNNRSTIDLVQGVQLREAAVERDLDRVHFHFENTGSRIASDMTYSAVVVGSGGTKATLGGTVDALAPGETGAVAVAARRQDRVTFTVRSSDDRVVLGPLELPPEDATTIVKGLDYALAGLAVELGEAGMITVRPRVTFGGWIPPVARLQVRVEVFGEGGESTYRASTREIRGAYDELFVVDASGILGSDLQVAPSFLVTADVTAPGDIDRDNDRAVWSSAEAAPQVRAVVLPGEGTSRPATVPQGPVGYEVPFQVVLEGLGPGKQLVAFEWTLHDSTVSRLTGLGGVVTGGEEGGSSFAEDASRLRLEVPAGAPLLTERDFDLTVGFRGRYRDAEGAAHEFSGTTEGAHVVLPLPAGVDLAVELVRGGQPMEANEHMVLGRGIDQNGVAVRVWNRGAVDFGPQMIRVELYLRNSEVLGLHNLGIRTERIAAGQFLDIPVRWSLPDRPLESYQWLHLRGEGATEMRAKVLIVRGEVRDVNPANDEVVLPVTTSGTQRPDNGNFNEGQGGSEG